MQETEWNERRDRFRGALVGTFVGDALGMPVEGQPAPMVAATWGRVEEMLPARLGRGTYTDDTQMMIGLAEALIECEGALDQTRIAACFASNYEPERGYGGNTHAILAAIRDGLPWEEVVRQNSLPGGSYANGAAMRVAPIALAFVGDNSRIHEAAGSQAAITGHHHPIASFGASIQALAIAQSLESGPHWDLEQFIRRLPSPIPDEFESRLRWIVEHPSASPEEAIATLGTGSRASASVPAALWAFHSARESAENAVICAVNLGGDADTIGAMAGAIAGAAHGSQAFPPRWLETLENGEKGLDYIYRLADRLAGIVYGNL